MTQAITPKTQFPPFMMFPKFLLKQHLGGTTLQVYLLLLDRTRLSMTKEEWTDADGRVFIIYTQCQLSEALARSERCIATALGELEKRGLIERDMKRQNGAYRIYVKFPAPEETCGMTGINLQPQVKESSGSAGRNLHGEPEEIFRSDLKKPLATTGRNVHTSNNNRVIMSKSNESNKERRAYGQYGNVLLTQDEYERLAGDFPNIDRMIENMSRYLASTGKEYRNYEAALRSWAAREPKAYENISYECEEGDSL